MRNIYAVILLYEFPGESVFTCGLFDRDRIY